MSGTPIVGAVGAGPDALSLGSVRLCRSPPPPGTTLVRYLELLTSVFLIKTIPAWTSGLTGRTVGTGKLAFVDTGIACHLTGQDAARLAEPDGAAGAMLENFVVMELARQLTWSEQQGRLFHYRTKDKVEADAVIETPRGDVIGIEVKAGATVRTEDLSGLRNLANLLGDRFVAGQQTLPFGDSIKSPRPPDPVSRPPVCAVSRAGSLRVATSMSGCRGPTTTTDNQTLPDRSAFVAIPVVGASAATTSAVPVLPPRLPAALAASIPTGRASHPARNVPSAPCRRQPGLAGLAKVMVSRRAVRPRRGGTPR
ncbi:MULTISPECIES: DUF4143 domain-containing protein [Streptomyces]|uniref:DUF4143 domain-containing protein n=1 Tax=Streptomyces lycopersici TaxID=2974589 RepID=UPI0021CF91A5|nr:DUF4143 domain-containing protein [Streptomyces sp. NEAU-383]